MNENTTENTPKAQVPIKKDFIPIVLYFVMQVVVCFILMAIWMMQGNLTISELSQNPKFMGIYIIVYGFISFAILCFLYRKKIAQNFKTLSKKKVVYTVLASIGIIIMNDIVFAFLQKLNVPTENQDTLVSLAGFYQIPYYFVLVFCLPFMEEMMCRYAIHTFFSNQSAFVIISSIIFALLHGIGIITLLYFLIGLGFSLIYIKTEENILCSTLAHALNNLTGVILLFF